MKGRFGLFLETNALDMKNFLVFLVEEPYWNKDYKKSSVRFTNS